MKKSMSLLMALTLTMALAGCSSSNTTAESTTESAAEATESTTEVAEAPAEEKETWVLAINATFPPFESIDADNPSEFVGVDIDIANHISEELGIDFEIQDMQFSALVNALTSNHADIIISGISPTEERLEVLDFTDSYFYPMNSIISAAGSGYTELSTIEGKKIGVSMGTSYANVAHTVEGAEVLELDSTPLVIQEILNGRCDAGIFDATQAAEFCAENEGLEFHTIPSEIAMSDTFAIALPKDSEYVDEINAIIAEMKVDGTLTAILEKHIGVEATAQYEEQIANLEIAQ